jgi:hypothetical protein
LRGSLGCPTPIPVQVMRADLGAAVNGRISPRGRDALAGRREPRVTADADVRGASACPARRTSSAVRLCAVLVFLTALSATRVGAADKPVIPGATVRLQPPPGFVPADRFPGFQWADAGSSIMVTEMPGPVGDVRAGMTKEGLASRGMTLRSLEVTRVAGREAILISVTQVASGVVVEKWMVLFGDESTTVMIVATFPHALASELRKPLRDAVLSAEWNPSRRVDRFEGLRFRLTETDRLKIANRMANMLLLTAGGVAGRLSPGDPFLVVGSSISEADIHDLERFARQRLARMVTIKDLTNIEGRQVIVDGATAYELTADARDEKADTALRVYQVVLLDGRYYYLFQGKVGAAKADEYLPEFRQVTKSFWRTR